MIIAVQVLDGNSTIYNTVSQSHYSHQFMGELQISKSGFCISNIQKIYDYYKTTSIHEHVWVLQQLITIIISTVLGRVRRMQLSRQLLRCNGQHQIFTCPSQNDLGQSRFLGILLKLWPNNVNKLKTLFICYLAYQ